MKISKRKNQNINDQHTVYDTLNVTYNKFLKSDIFYGHGTDNAWDEAIYLILSILDLSKNLSKKVLNSYIDIKKNKIIQKLINKRINKRIPIAYLTNKAWFCGHKFYIDKRVLIPRSPIAEIINNKFSSIINYEPYHILDMCTGSGCIAISCSYKFPNAKIDASDFSKKALAVAKKNIFLHKLENKISLIHSNLFSAINKKYDLIITNPPYVYIKDIKKLPKEYLYEPIIGLNGGSDKGLNIVYKIISCAKKYLTNQGILICEVGKNMSFLKKKYNNIPFKWLKLNNGGQGIFALNKYQMINIKKYFF